MPKAQSLGGFTAFSRKKNATKVEDIFDEQVENCDVDASALHRKLKSKVEALKIMRDELKRIRNERDQFKLMAETLQLRYSSVKRQGDCGNDDKPMSGTNLLLEAQELNIKLTAEVALLKLKVTELQGDLDLLRMREASINEKLRNDENAKKELHKEEQMWKKERKSFIRHLENLKKENAKLAFDFKTVISEREEIIMERDGYKSKAHRLNHELYGVMNINKSHPKFLDVDSIISENRHLQERLRNVEIEYNTNKETLNRLKIKNVMDLKRNKSIIKMSTERNDNKLLTQKQVKQIVDNGIDLPGKLETIDDFRTLCCSILEQLNDKNVAIMHQKKANKTLAARNDDLEKRINALLSIDTSESMYSDFSPSEILLRDYTSTAVNGSENEAEVLVAEAKLNANKKEKNQMHYATYALQYRQLRESSPEPSEDGFSSLSTESVQSSQYTSNAAADNLSGTANSDYYANHNDLEVTFSSAADGKSLFMTKNTIAQRRKEELEDLSPELADMVLNALHELDDQEFHTVCV